MKKQNLTKVQCFVSTINVHDMILYKMTVRTVHVRLIQCYIFFPKITITMISILKQVAIERSQDFNSWL